MEKKKKAKVKIFGKKVLTRLVSYIKLNLVSKY